MKRIKMGLYGEPGTGKSVFGSKWPKPFFITTDGNYEWLEDFGADPNAHRQVYSWSEAKQVFESLKNDTTYETIVVDLTEDLFKWCEQEYCIKAKIDHVSDVGYGKGYDISRNEFFIEICKLFGLDKHILLIMHGGTVVVKDRRGVEHTKYVPSNRIPDKVLDMIEGRTRYFLRCYLRSKENPDGTVTKERMLSLVPKENEFGVLRGIMETDTLPQDIPLDFDEFAKAIKLYTDDKFTIKTVVEPTTTVDSTTTVETKTPVTKVQLDTTPVEVTQTVTIPENPSEISVVPQTTQVVEPVKTATTEPTPTQQTQTTESVKTTANGSTVNADRLAAIKAKMAALKNGNK